jgi:hypothetical protein
MTLYQKGDRVLKKNIASGILEGTVTLAFKSFQTREDCLQIKWDASGRISTTKPDAVLPHTPENLKILEGKWDRRHAKQAQA